MGHRSRAILSLIVALCTALAAGAQRQGLAADRAPQRTVSLVIELEAPPAAAALSTAMQLGLAPQAIALQTQQQVARIERAQQRLLGSLSGMRAQVLYRTQRVYNGVAVRVEAARAAEIARLPGVRAVHRLLPKRPMNTASVPLIGAPQLWSLATGYTGAGVEIAVIDTGVDYVHRMFGGSGSYAGITDASAFAPTPKVTRGYDFVGDSYDGSNAPAPDGNPMDCHGHGTHVAGTAAGFGVLANGSTFTGPWTSTTHSGTTFRIAPGVAPEATLVALRVFGCGGDTEFVDPAIEWAVDPNGDGDLSDRVDVINMSLGADYGSTYDATAIAAENAAAAGVIVVAAAGNAGDSHFIVGSPSTADSVISVAASTQSTATFDGISVNAPSGIAGLRAALFSSSYSWQSASDVTDDVYYPAANRAACASYSPGEAANIAGRIVIVDWTDGECGSAARTANVAAAGGVGAILVDNSEIFDLAIFGSATIPAVSAPRSVGEALKANLGGLNITFSGSYLGQVAYTDPRLSDIVAGFSSRGPRRGGALKPDVAAPGAGIFSAATGTGDQGYSSDGTSMAAPHVAGAMALLRQIHPGWSAQELKALVMNGAVSAVRIGLGAGSPLLGPARVGAGRVTLEHTAGLQILAFDADAPELVSVSFGDVEVVQPTTLTRTVSIVNKGSAPETLSLAYAPATTIPGVTYRVLPATVAVAAGAATEVSVVMSAGPAAMRHTLDPTMTPTQDGAGRFFIAEASGHLVASRPAAAQQYRAMALGAYENPPSGSARSATASLGFSEATRGLTYSISLNQAITLSGLGAQIQRGAAGANGDVAHTLAGSAGATVTALSGAVTLSPADAALLKRGELYLNFYTAAGPAGELRGQIVPTGELLRLPVYATARPASDMGAAVALDWGDGEASVVSGTVTLDGVGLEGTILPTETLSIASILELAHTSPQIAAGDAPTGFTDLQHIGVGSNIAAAGAVSESTLLFGIATYGEWSSANEVQLVVKIDTDEDGVNDYMLYTASLSFGDQSDTGKAILANLAPDGSVESEVLAHPLNVLGPAVADTQPYNTGAIVLAVDAADLGLVGSPGTELEFAL